MLGRLGMAALRLRESQVDEQDCAGIGLEGLLERAPEVARGHLGRAFGERALSGGLKSCPCRGLTWRAAQQMNCNLSWRGTSAREHPRGRGVQPGPCRCREVAIQGVANDRMREREL